MFFITSSGLIHLIAEILYPFTSLSLFTPNSPIPRCWQVFFYYFYEFDILLKIIYFNWRIITLPYCEGFCHTSTWVSHGCTRVPASWTLLEPPSPPCPCRLSQSTGLGALLHASNLALVIYFTYGNIHIPVLSSQIIPPSPSPTESKSLFFTSVSLLLPGM